MSSADGGKPAPKSTKHAKTPLFPPCSQLAYSRFLDKLGDQRRAPEWTFNRSASDSGLVKRSAAASIQPGQYKADRDFVNDITSEVRKDVDARFRQAPRCTFGENPRYDESGVLKGVRNPGNMKLWFNPVGPGQYQPLDGIESSARVHWMSSPAWSQRRGKPAEDVRAAKAAGCAPGPGYYAPQTKVEPRGKRTVCKNAGQFSLIFQRIGASAGPNSYVPRRRSESVEPLGSDHGNSAPPSRG